MALDIRSRLARLRAWIAQAIQPTHAERLILADPRSPAVARVSHEDRFQARMPFARPRSR